MSRGWDEIRIVTDPDELEKIYRFRYQVYVEEMGRPQFDADHEHKRIEDKLDKGAHNFAAFKGDDIVGVVRVNFPSESDIGYYADLYRMHELNGDHPAATSIVTRLMIAPALRRGLLGTRLASTCYALGIDRGTRWAFIDCNDHLIDFFQGLGFRSYIGKISHAEYGDVTPMRLECLDIEHLIRVRSPFRSHYYALIQSTASTDINKVSL